MAEDLDVTVTDNDEPGLDLSKTSLGPTEGASESYTVALLTQPTAEVTVTITAPDAQLAAKPSLRELSGAQIVQSITRGIE